MKDQVRTIIESFENDEISDVAAIEKLQKVTGRQIDLDWLRDYWSSESQEDFIDQLCAEPIPDNDLLSDSDALSLITEYQQTDSPGRRDAIQTALDRRYGKPTGTLSDLVCQQGFSDPAKILEELKKDTRIYL